MQIANFEAMRKSGMIPGMPAGMGGMPGMPGLPGMPPMGGALAIGVLHVTLPTRRAAAGIIIAQLLLSVRD